MLFIDYTKEWLEEQEGKVKPLTHKIYSDLIKRHLIPQFGNIHLNRITENIMNQYISSLYKAGNLSTEKGLSNNSIAQITSVLKSIFKFAKKKKLIKYDLANDLECKGSDAVIETLTEEEQRRLEKYIIKKKDPRLYGVLIALYTGIRIGELLALKWENVDLKDKTLTIKETQCVINKLGHIDNTPKTDAGRRIVPFPLALLPYLKELKQISSEYVLTNRRNSFIKIRAYQKSFTSILEKLKIKHKGFHSLRHTFATRAIESGADIKTLSEILGHSSPTITLRTYVHSSSKQKKRLSEKVGERLKKYAQYVNRRTFFHHYYTKK